MAVAVERGLDRGMAELRLDVLRVRSLCDHVAELLRIKDEILLQAGAPNAAGAAEELFRHAIDWGRREDALSWELRGATSLARLYHRRGRATQVLGWRRATAARILTCRD
jgi:hypothetical protein